ncbi:hypothetical protein BJX70DRAFT_376086 [Aspergillus crustosus]
MLPLVNIVINTASAMNPTPALYLINALGKQKEASGRKTYFIQTSGISAFYESTGWPAGQFKDTDAIFETEKRLAELFAVRKVWLCFKCLWIIGMGLLIEEQTNVTIIEHATNQGVSSFVVVVPTLVYGQGTGEWNKVSVILPVHVQASLRNKAVYKFPENTNVSAVHISDLTALYGQIVANIDQGHALPAGKEGYYFAVAHDVFLEDVLDRLALALKARGLLADAKLRIYPNDQVAAEVLGVPEQFVQMLWNSGDNIVAELPHRIGWQPTWSKDRFLENINDEIDTALEVGKAKSGLIDTLFKAAQG